MPIKEIKKCAVLRAAGDNTLIERMEMLINHRSAINQEIARMQENLDKLDLKIDYYQTEIGKVGFNFYNSNKN